VNIPLFTGANLHGITLIMLFLTLPLIATVAGAVLQVDYSTGNLSLQHPELFSLHWQMLEQNSTSGFETPMVDFLSGYLESKGLTVELQPVQNPILAYVLCVCDNDL
jgi:hypothetical protein